MGFPIVRYIFENPLVFDFFIERLATISLHRFLRLYIKMNVYIDTYFEPNNRM